MKRIIAVLFLSFFLCGFAQIAHAQYKLNEDLYFSKDIIYEVGASLGVMNWLTDLGGQKGIGKNFIKNKNVKNSKKQLMADTIVTSVLKVRSTKLHWSQKFIHSILKNGMMAISYQD